MVEPTALNSSVFHDLYGQAHVDIAGKWDNNAFDVCFRLTVCWCLILIESRFMAGAKFLGHQ